MFNVEFEEVTNQFCAEFDTVVHTGDAALGEKTITANGVYNASSDNLDGYSKVNVNVPTGGGTPVIESLSVTPTTSQQTYNEPGVDGYKPVVVAAMPTGTEGTPTATKGTVSNHSIAVTPSVTNVAGYIAGGTKTGTPVAVSASELVSGTKSITANGSNQDVVGYAAVDVAVPNSYSASDEGKVVSNGALVAQTSDIVTVNDTYDTTLINSLTVNVSGGSSVEHGTFTPTERLLSHTITTDQDRNNFIVFANEGFTYALGTAAMLVMVYGGLQIGTNNGGTSTGLITSTQGTLTKSGKDFTYAAKGTLSSSTRAWQAGVTYHWFAW